MVIHHRYVNITGYDTDIDLGGIGRLSPHLRWRWFHRWQHFYLWPLYGLLAIKLQLVTDFRMIFTGRIGPHRFPRPKGLDLALFLGGKAAFLALAFGVPLMFHSIWVVAFYYGVVALDFSKRNPVATWPLGGLNYHCEHHLLPTTCHINYPEISKVVEETCRDFGVKYREHRSFRAGVAAHYRWLRQMGRPTSAAGRRSSGTRGPSGNSGGP